MSHIWMSYVTYELVMSHMGMSHMGWLRLVGSLKLQVSFAEYSLFYRALLQKRPMSHMGMSQVIRTNESCHICVWVMSHIWHEYHTYWQWMLSMSQSDVTHAVDLSATCPVPPPPQPTWHESRYRDLTYTTFLSPWQKSAPFFFVFQAHELFLEAAKKGVSACFFFCVFLDMFCVHISATPH